MKKFSLLSILVILFLTKPILCTDDNRLKNEYPFKRKINNIENVDIQNNEKGLKGNDQSRIPHKENNYNQINVYSELGQSDNNLLLQEVQEFGDQCINDLKKFATKSTDTEIIDDILNKKFISNYKMLIQKLKNDIEKKNSAKTATGELILKQLICLRNIYSIEEFYHIIKNLSEIYTKNKNKLDRQWTYKTKNENLTLIQALIYIICIKSGEYEGKISEIRKKAEQEGNRVIPAILCNRLPNINQNDAQPLQSKGRVNDSVHSLYPSPPIKNVRMENKNYIYPPQIPQNQHYGYQPPFWQPNQNFNIMNNGCEVSRLKPVYPVYNAGVENNNPLSQELQELQDYLFLPQELQNHMSPPQELQKPIENLEELFQYLDEIADQMNRNNLLNKSMVPELEKEQKKEIITQGGGINFDFKQSIPSFKNVQDIRDFYNIKSGI